jgi:outer membrane receptor protein involved in Fe transport
MKFIICFLTGILSAVATVFCQPAAEGGADGTISGIVVDKQTGQPLEYVSIGVFRMRDSSVVGGVITNSQGIFSMKGLPYGKFFVDAKFLGFKKSRIKGVTIVPAQKSINMGTITLEPANNALREVEVTGQKSQLEYKIDRKVVNVGQQLTAAGGTAVDVLENTPSVQTDVEGNVQLRGSSSFTVLIDGKPSILKGSEALQQIPASTIESIEIITNPSAKYDPDGSAGIINIIMKKQKVSGFNGVVNLSAGTGDKYNGDVLINFKTNKFTYTLGGEYGDLKFHNTGRSESMRISTNGDTLFQNSSDEGNMHRTNYGVKGGVEYSINDRNTLTFSGRVASRSFGRSSVGNSNELTRPSGLLEYYQSGNDSKNKHFTYNGNLDYFLKIDDKGQQLTSSVTYSSGPEDRNNDIIKQYTDAYGSNLDSVEFQNVKQNGAEYNLRIKADYTLPINEKGKLEAGYQSRLEGGNSDYHLKEFINNQWVEDLSYYNDMDHYDHVEALYATFSNSFSLFDYQLGLRGEYYDRELKQKVNNEKYLVNRFDLFPTVHLSKQLPWNLQVMTSYSRRVNRPDDRDLNPFAMYMDKLNIRMGNPNLKPEFTNSFEMSLQKRMGEAFISVEGFYRRTNDLISQVVNVRDDLVSVYTTTNMNHDISVGSEIMLNLPLTKTWMVNATTSIYHYELIGSLTDEDAVSKTTNTWNSRVNTTLRFKWGMQLQGNLMYNAATITAQGKRDAFYFSSIGVRQELFKKKASLTLQARDVFGKMKFAFRSTGSNFRSYNEMHRESPVFTLTFSYRLNNYKQQGKRGSGEGGGEETNESDFSGGM